MGILARIFGADETVRDANRFETRAFDPSFDWRFTGWGMKAHTYIPSSDVAGGDSYSEPANWKPLGGSASI